MRIVLKLHGLGHVPSMKNNKMLTRGKLITKPEYQIWIDRCIRSFESQLLSLCQTGGGEMLMEGLQPSLTPWLNQFDDSVSWIPSGSWEVKYVPKGEEGAIVTLETI
jgi:hypothetical protein